MHKCIRFVSIIHNSALCIVVLCLIFQLDENCVVFLGYAAKLGCSKCFKSFPGTAGSMDYSGFQRSSWLPRNNTEHRDRIHRVSQAKTKVEQTTLESSFWCHYSVLLQLAYFDAPRMLVIDPMHNLCLGTGKDMLHF